MLVSSPFVPRNSLDSFFFFALFRINNYVKNGLLKKCNDPTPIQTYTRGKALGERNSGDIKSDPFLSNCVTGE